MAEYKRIISIDPTTLSAFLGRARNGINIRKLVPTRTPLAEHEYVIEGADEHRRAIDKLVEEFNI